MKKICYPEDEWGGNWRWDDYPSTDVERAEICNNVRCAIYPEQYTDNCRYIYDMADCENTSVDYTNFYEVEVSGKCVKKIKCETYGDYYMCEDTFVKSLCEYNCVIFDQCTYESPSSYCEDYEDLYETVDGTCKPKDWCDIFTDYYEDDISSVESKYYKPLFKKC